MNAGLRLHLEGTEQVPVVRAVGEIDLATASVLRDALAALHSDTEMVIVDLTEVTFLDSTGLSVLIASWKRQRASNLQGGFRLVVTKPVIKRVLDVTGLAQVFEIFSSLEEALTR